MNKQHKLTMSKIHYPRRLRIIECNQCSYALAVTVDEHGFIERGSKIKINAGDSSAAHGYFHS